MANANNRLFHCHGVPSPRQAAKLVLSTANGASSITPATGTRRDDSATRGNQSHLLWLRRMHALLKRRGMACNPKTEWRVLRRLAWLSTSRRGMIPSGPRHEGRVHVSEPNRRWASDITSIRAWDGQKGRLAVMIDCANRMVLAWRFARRITATDLTEMLRKHSGDGLETHGSMHEESSFSTTMDRNTPRIGSGHSSGRWD